MCFLFWKIILSLIIAKGKFFFLKPMKFKKMWMLEIDIFCTCAKKLMLSIFFLLQWSDVL
ncbi:hypothetical protein HMPREF3038_01097 [Akkermansia sp. KLE1797]|nr:hypothetical protein HMPREF3038_01097 [Akkermansia sp. KLE1797]KZA05076.1 hypothetical protein HMPREF1326_01111 [Akkermansia sp. KLE1605]